MLQTRVNSFRRVYRLSRWFRLRFTPAGQLLLLAIVLSGAIGVDATRNLSYQIFCLLLTIVVLAVLFSTFSRNRFESQRRLPQTATVGERLHYSLIITNLSNKPAADLFVADQLQDECPGEHELRRFRDEVGQRENRFDQLVGYPRWVRLIRIKSGAHPPTFTIPSLPSRQKVEWTVPLTPLRRGYLYFRDTYIGSPELCGVFRSFVKNKNRESILVLPKRYPVPKLNLHGRRHFHPGGVVLASTVGESSEFHGLRDYQPGDPLRHIHWRSWARTGKPVVKKFEDEFFVRHALLLDTYTQNAGTQQFEEAVSVAASLALELSDQESLLDLIFVNKRALQFTSGRHTSDLQSMLEILACVKEEFEQPFEMLARLVMDHSARLSSVIGVFLSWDEPRRALVSFLKNAGVNVLILQICDRIGSKDIDPSPDIDDVPWLQRLYVGDIESGLKALGQHQEFRA